MLKIRRPLGRLIFNMGIAIPGKTVFLTETAPSNTTLDVLFNVSLNKQLNSKVAGDLRCHEAHATVFKISAVSKISFGPLPWWAKFCKDHKISALADPLVHQNLYKFVIKKILRSSKFCIGPPKFDNLLDWMSIKIKSLFLKAGNVTSL